MSTISIQPGQPGEGMGYNVNKPLPYPFHIDPETGECKHGRGTAEFDGATWTLLGFQAREDVKHVDLYRHEWLDDPQQAVGMFPVFGGGDAIFNLTVPITDVTVVN